MRSSAALIALITMHAHRRPVYTGFGDKSSAESRTVAAFGVKVYSGRADGPNMNLTRDKFRRTLGAFGLLSMVLVGSACAGGDPPAAAVVTVSAAQALDFTSAPALTGKPVFTIKGKGIDDRFTDGLELDIATLERLRVVEAEIEDPWEKRSVRYRGVLMSDLVKAIAPEGAAAMRFTALDDYEVTLPMKDLRSRRRAARDQRRWRAPGDRAWRPDADRLPAAIGGREQPGHVDLERRGDGRGMTNRLARRRLRPFRSSSRARLWPSSSA